jgi:proteasome alpha subunit
LANLYARTLGELFLTGAKPFEVEIGVAEVGHTPATDRLYQISFDGTLLEHDGLLVLGGNEQELRDQLEGQLGNEPGELTETIGIIRDALGATDSPVELALLDRDPQTLRGTHRAFRRLDPQAL